MRIHELKKDIYLIRLSLVLQYFLVILVVFVQETQKR